MLSTLEKISVAVILCVVVAAQAHAYIDPGSGSMIMTTILGVIAAVGYTMRKYFYRLKSVFRPKQGDNVKPGSNADEPAEGFGRTEPASSVDEKG